MCWGERWHHGRNHILRATVSAIAPGIPVPVGVGLLSVDSFTPAGSRWFSGFYFKSLGPGHKSQASVQFPPLPIWAARPPDLSPGWFGEEIESIPPTLGSGGSPNRHNGCAVLRLLAIESLP